LGSIAAGRGNVLSGAAVSGTAEPRATPLTEISNTAIAVAIAVRTPRLIFGIPFGNISSPASLLRADRCANLCHFPPMPNGMHIDYLSGRN
jgi:hypothetical protein